MINSLSRSCHFIAIATEIVINSEITKKGVFTPEEAISNPMEFFNRYVKRYFRMKKRKID
ncbi:MAG: hypothetical protein ACXAEX_06240 [Promethearchaeota archaeon]